MLSSLDSGGAKACCLPSEAYTIEAVRNGTDVASKSVSAVFQSYSVEQLMLLVHARTR